MDIKIFLDKDTWIEESIRVIKSAKTVALSGGKTPIPIYKKLKLNEAWLVDEHANGSNSKMIMRTLAPKKLHGILNKKFDLIVLGIGTDGHFASIFTKPRKDRKSMNLKAILSSKKILILLSGKEKRNILKDLLFSDKKFPAKQLLKHKDLTIHAHF